jgi:hypothetical protein
MNPIVISCKASDWKNALKVNLQDGIEADLINFDYVAGFGEGTQAQQYFRFWQFVHPARPYQRQAGGLLNQRMTTARLDDEINLIRARPIRARMRR